MDHSLLTALKSLPVVYLPRRPKQAPLRRWRKRGAALWAIEAQIEAQIEG